MHMWSADRVSIGELPIGEYARLVSVLPRKVILVAFILLAALPNPVRGQPELDEAFRRSSLLRVRIFIETRQWSKAEEELDRILELTPRDPDALGALGSVYRQTGRLNKAEEIYLHMLAVYPERPGLRKELAYLFYDQGRFRESIKMIERIFRSPEGQTDTDLVLLIAAAHDALGKPETADSFYAFIVKQYPENAMLLVRVAEGLMGANRNLAALGFFEQAYALDPKNFRTLRGMGVILAYREPGRSRQFLLDALPLNEIEYEVPYLLGEAFSGFSEPRAAEYFTEAMRRIDAHQRNDLYSLTVRARILYKLGKAEDAVQALRTLVASYPDNISLRNSLAELLIDLKRYDEALELLEKFKGRL